MGCQGFASLWLWFCAQEAREPSILQPKRRESREPDALKAETQILNQGNSCWFRSTVSISRLEHSLPFSKPLKPSSQNPRTLGRPPPPPLVVSFSSLCVFLGMAEAAGDPPRCGPGAWEVSDAGAVAGASSSAIRMKEARGVSYLRDQGAVGCRECRAECREASAS